MTGSARGNSDKGARQGSGRPGWDRPTRRLRLPPATSLFNVVAHVETRAARQCPACRRKWPFDWDYCPECAVWIRGTDCGERVTRLVPAVDSEYNGSGPDELWSGAASKTEGAILACEIRCPCEQPGRGELQKGRDLLQGAMAAITAHGGRAWAGPGRGALGCWVGGDGADAAARAAAAILPRETSRSDGRPESLRGVCLCVGIALGGSPQDCPADPGPLAFRLASLAHANGGLVSQAIYRRTLERFDYRGVAPAVPRSEPLPGPVFELLGPKPERSGTHHVGPERVPLVGRRRLLHALDASRRQVAGGAAVVLHVIGEPGAGKSKLLREWLAAAEGNGALTAWIRLQAHGVPYGGYSNRAWGHLIAPLCGRAAGDAPVGVLPPREVLRRLRAAGRPALIVVDDLHWVDTASRQALARLIAGLGTLPALVILAYRPSFATAAPSGSPIVHRRVQVRGLEGQAMRQLIAALAAHRNLALTPALRDEIAAKARGNPLYAEEAIAHGAAPLPHSLPELLIQRIGWALDSELPEIERRTRATGLVLGLEREAALRRLDSLEEQVSAWLDRLDVIEEAARPLIRQFLRGLQAIDGRLALLSLFLGRQRPHCHRLAQALARLGYRGDVRGEAERGEHGPAA